MLSIQRREGPYKLYAQYKLKRIFKMLRTCRKTMRKGVTRSLIPWTYPEAGCLKVKRSMWMPMTALMTHLMAQM